MDAIGEKSSTTTVPVVPVVSPQDATLLEQVIRYSTILLATLYYYHKNKPKTPIAIFTPHHGSITNPRAAALEVESAVDWLPTVFCVCVGGITLETTPPLRSPLELDDSGGCETVLPITFGVPEVEVVAVGVVVVCASVVGWSWKSPFTSEHPRA